MATSIQDVRDLDLGGAFTSLLDEQIQIYLDLAGRMISADAWGECYDQAHALLAAHLTQEGLQAASGTVGPITSAKAGGLSVTYGGGGIDGEPSGTRYVEMLDDLWYACSSGTIGVITGTASCGGKGYVPSFFAGAVAPAGGSGGFSDIYKAKLDGIEDGATANSTDAELRDRATHTGTQLAATISDFSAAVDARIALNGGGGGSTDLTVVNNRLTALETGQGVQDTAITAAQTKADANETAIAALPGPVDLAPLTARVDTLETDQTTQDTAIGGLQTALAGKADTASPALTGVPTAPTATSGTDTTQLATTAFVQDAIAGFSTGGAPIDSPTFTGDPKAPNPPLADNDTSIATTAFVKAQGYAPLQSPQFQGTPQAPTPAPTDNSNQLVTTAWVQNRAYATVNSPAFTGTPTVPTPAPTDNSSQIATTSFVQNKDYAPRASPVLLGTPTAPTAANGTNTQQVATCEFVQDAVATNAAVVANSAKVTNATHTGDVTGDTALTIADSAVSLAKMADFPSGSLMGRRFGSGPPEAIPLGPGLEFNATTGLRASNILTILSQAKWAVFPDNRWIVSSKDYGLAYSDMTESAGTGSSPAIQYEAYSFEIPGFSRLDSVDLWIRNDDPLITNVRFQYYLQGGTSGSWTNAGQTTSSFLAQINTPLVVGWNKVSTTGALVFSGGFFVVYMRPTSTVASQTSLSVSMVAKLTLQG